MYKPGGIHMNAIERIQMVKAMEFIMRNVNSEEYIESWLMDGVADGDIPYGCLTAEPNDAEDLSYYFEDDKDFAALMQTFLACISEAATDGGLYCDGVCGCCDVTRTPEIYYNEAH